MKRLLLLFIFLSNFTVAQEQDLLIVNESEKKFNEGNFNSFNVKISQARFKDVKSGWKKYLNKKSKINPKESSGEFILRNAIIEEITTDTIIIYSVITENEENVELTASFAKDETEIYSSKINPAIADNIKIFIRSFALTAYKEAVGNELTAEKKKLTKLNQELSYLKTDSVNYEKKIRSNKRDIEKLEGAVKSNKSLLEIKSNSIDQEQKILATFTSDSEMKVEEEKKLKNLQKEKKKVEKEIDSQRDDIEEKEDDIKSMEKLLEKNTEEVIPAKKKEIEKQIEHIDKIEEKLKSIR